MTNETTAAGNESHGTRRVILTLTAYQRREYTECLEVPVGITPDELNRLVNLRNAQVGADEYTTDPESWDYSGGTTEPVHDELDLAPTQRVSIVGDRLVVTEID